MKLVPLYHVKHFKGDETHTIGKFSSKEKANEHARRFIKGMQYYLEEKGIETIVALTQFRETGSDQDTTMYTMTDTKHNPTGDHSTIAEGVIVSFHVPTTPPDAQSFFNTLDNRL